MSNAYERRGAQLNMESLYIRHDVISERAMSARPSVIRDS